jgi:uncharacterized delta-60 repeat protein
LFRPFVSLLLAAGLFGLPWAAQATPGDLDPLNASVAGSYVVATALQPDGKTILAGSFSSVLGVARISLARLNANGTLDTGFNPKPNSDVYSVAVQPDGKILIGGAFTTLQPNGAGATTARQYIARLNADGTLDTSFDPKANAAVSSVVVQANGKILLGGSFTTLQPNGAGASTARQYIARVNADGTLDTGFNPKASNNVLSLAEQADGKVLLGGLFTTLQPNGAVAATARQSIARVNADGTLDTGFDPKANTEVSCVAVQADGKVLLGGRFTTLQPNGATTATARQYIARVNADGTLDTGFNPKASSFVANVTLQTDGKVLFGGEFTSVQPNGAAASTTRQYIARVNADGTLDTGFDPKADNFVYSIVVQADGLVLIGGRFNTLQPNGAGATTARTRLARLVNDPATQTLSAPDSTQTLWQRGGAGPEMSRVTFEVSTNGGTTWGTLVAGTRIGTTSNWLLTGLSLPANGHLRARGVTSGGYTSGTSSLIEQVVAFDVATLPPTLTAPASSTLTDSPVSVAFTLPEPALPGSVTLTFAGSVSRVLVLAASQDTSGAHAFTFMPSAPLASAQIFSGNAIPDGVYTVTLSYQDLVGNAAAQAAPAVSVLIDTAPPTIAPPVGGFLPLTLVTGQALPNYTAQAVTFDSVGVSSVAQLPAIGSTLAPGVTNVTVTATDALGHSANTAFTVTMLSFSNDTDGDGMNDASEFQMATLGFNWEVNQSTLVNTYQSTANGAGYFTAAQVQALHVGTPLIQRHPTTGVFTLTLGVQKSSDLIHFNAFPMTAPQTTINGAGKLEFFFTVPDNAAFFRVQSP